MSRDQQTVVAGAISATIFSLAFFEVIFRMTDFGLAPPGGIGIDYRLEYALKCEVFAALCLLAGVGAIGNRRFFAPDAIGGDPTPAIEIERRYVQNTLEQLVLAIVGHLALVLIVPDDSTRVVAILVMLFVIGRAAFWIGYHISPPARAFGFATTFYPTVAVYVYLVSRLAS
ncbi:MAG TPA: MAPEG family protein [Candidatus Binatus sp.]|nr:MAPEG family protein [Candidatus Binatus sp.]